MRTWQVERRKRTRHLIELGGLVVKAGIVELTNDDRATIYGALLWIAAKLQSHEGEHARDLWAAKGRQAFDAERREERMGPANVATVGASSGRREARTADFRRCASDAAVKRLRRKLSRSSSLPATIFSREP